MILSCSSQVDGHHLFLKTEAMLALNQSLGSFPLSVEHWKIAHIVGTSWWAQVFSIMFGIRYGPWALLILILRRHFLTPSTVHGQGFGFPCSILVSGSRGSSSSIVKTDLNCSTRICACSFRSFISCPILLSEATPTKS